jgi:hypothetical protein
MSEEPTQMVPGRRDATYVTFGGGLASVGVWQRWPHVPYCC